MTCEADAQVRGPPPRRLLHWFDAMGVAASGESWRTAAHEWFEARLDDPDYGMFVVEADGAVVAPWSRDS